MRTLRNSLVDHDRGFLHIIAELWGMDPPTGSLRQVAETLCGQMLDPENLEEIIGSLPAEIADALFDLVQQGGSSPWHTWSRKYGELRPMGPGKRDREQPWRSACSTSEALWYRGLLGRAFIDSAKGPEEVAYLPTEILNLLANEPDRKLPLSLQPIEPPLEQDAAAAPLIDDCTTLLAALRRQVKPSRAVLMDPLLHSHLIHPQSLQLCLALMREIGLIRKGTLEADLDAVPEFLLADRMLSLQHLYMTWKHSTSWNDLADLPSLRTGRDSWPNDPLLPRRTLLRWLAQLKVGSWYSITDLVRAIYEEDPAFQRPGGQFDTWYLQDKDGVPLDGIEHWFTVEGTLLRTLMTGPLRWFGAVQLGYEMAQGPVSGFTPTKLFSLLEDPGSKLPAVEEKGVAIVRADGSVAVPRLAPRSLRYQLARLLEWEGQTDQVYHYRLSIRAMKRAQHQGLEFKQVRSILAQASESELPPAVIRAMQDFEVRGYEAKIDQHQLLRVSSPDLLDSLLNQPSTQKYILERLNQTTAIVQNKHWDKLIRAAVALGILIDGPQADTASPARK